MTAVLPCAGIQPRSLTTLLTGLLAAFIGAVVPASAADDFLPALPALLGVACTPPYIDAQKFRTALPGVRVLEHDVTFLGSSPGRARTLLLYRNGTQTEIQSLFPGSRLRRASIEFHDGRPISSVSTDDRCQITEARWIGYGDNGHADYVRVFAPDLKTVTLEIPLNPPVPEGHDPGGMSVGLIDSGVNYTIPPFSTHLARDVAGTLLGRDLWDGDARPFDIDTGRSAFFPLHHGSAVMSVLIREATMARVLPVRYPRPDMTRMADAVNWLAEAGARVVNLAMGSNNRADWDAFEMAARRFPKVLFIISAGNDGRNIDREPVYPAALGLPNAIVVTSSELDGRLAAGSNWGPGNVDLMVPAERIDVIDHRGAPGKASGSSFAVPRVAALAVRMLAQNPDWHGPELRDAILKRARPGSGEKLTRYGWIPDPSDGP